MQVTTEEQNQYIQIGVDKEKYAIKISDIQEIIKMQSVTRVPHMDSHVKGIINLRGNVIPVISLCSIFGLSENEYTKSTRIVVMNHGDHTAGLIVDHVDKVTTFNDLQTPPETVGGISSNFFKSIGTTVDGLVGVLNLEDVLANN